ncbi:pyridoxamine 5'-phosphate oxidase family protein [Candidatus Bathyarchaeota archaeon]|nr:pyridoxamine 5'-phosphate oxidase family protein [Candidatus Bathyarchaeota archaeon]
MRRQDKEITDKEVMEDFLRDQEVGRLATSLDGKPYVVPINFVYTNGKIIFHSHINGKKMEIISKNQFICFEVDTYTKKEADNPCNYSYNYMSVIIYGRTNIITDNKKKLNYLKTFINKYAYEMGGSFEMDDLLKFKNLILVEVNIDSMTGKKSI